METPLAKCVSPLEAIDLIILDLEKQSSQATESLEFVFRDIAAIKKNSVANADLLERLNRIDDHCQVTRSRVNVLDNKCRNKNVRIINLNEDESKSQEQLRVRGDKIIQHTGIQCCSINAFRIGEHRLLARGIPSNLGR